MQNNLKIKSSFCCMVMSSAGYDFFSIFFASRWQCFGNAKTKMEVGLEMWRKKALQLYLAF